MFTSFKEFKNKITENNDPVLDNKNILTLLLNNTELNSLFKHDLLNSTEGKDYIFYKEEDIYTFAFTVTKDTYYELYNVNVTINGNNLNPIISKIINNLGYELVDSSLFIVDGQSDVDEYKCYIDFKLKDENIQEIFGYSQKEKDLKQLKLDIEQAKKEIANLDISSVFRQYNTKPESRSSQSQYSVGPTNNERIKELINIIIGNLKKYLPTFLKLFPNILTDIKPNSTNATDVRYDDGQYKNNVLSGITLSSFSYYILRSYTDNINQECKTRMNQFLDNLLVKNEGRWSGGRYLDDDQIDAITTSDHRGQERYYYNKVINKFIPVILMDEYNIDDFDCTYKDLDNAKACALKQDLNTKIVELGKVRAKVLENINYRNTKFTPEMIDPATMTNKDIFVFGSNTEGKHYGGAAAAAVKYYGAIMGQAYGLQGNSYAIVTMQLGGPVKTLTAIRHQIINLLHFINKHPELTFWMTKIGCGIAGFTVEEMATVFNNFNIPKNLILPKEFVELNY